MTEDDFREGMNRASREDRLFFVANDEDFGIAVGYDSGKGVAILHQGKELPLSDLREIRLGA